MKVFGIDRISPVGNPKGEEWLVKDGQPVNGMRRADIMVLQKDLNLKPATIHQTMGPNWKRIYWINDRPLAVR
jgi:hypothetical protein